MKNTKLIGSYGEELAKKYLQDNGHDILITNYLSPYGEIDIIAKIFSYIVFVEVKLRKNINYGLPREAVSKAKQRKILDTANIFIETNNLTNTDFRFDVIEIINHNNMTTLEHIKNAF